MTLYIVRAKKRSIRTTKRVRIRQDIEIATIWRNTPSWSGEFKIDDITVERVNSEEQGWKSLDDKPLLWNQ